MPSGRLWMTRRTLLAGAAAGAAAVRPWRAPRAAGAVVSIDVTQGNVQPMPIALPDFVGGSAERQRGRAQHHPGHHRQSEALRPVRADRSRRLHREGLEHRRAAALCRLARHQRPGARHRPHHPPGRRPAEVGIPAVGRGVRRAAHRRAVFHRARHLAPRRAHHLRRDLPAPDRRDRAISTAASCSSTNPGRRSSASSGSPSWTRTAPTCAS